jgi:hypothetical protein
VNLTPEERAQVALFKTRLAKAMERVRKSVRGFDEMMTNEFEEVEEAITAYNEHVGEINEYIEVLERES